MLKQLSYVEIDFDGEVCALILLVSLLNSLEPMRAVFTDSLGYKFNFNDIRDHILAKKVSRIDSGEISSLSSDLNL